MARLVVIVGCFKASKPFPVYVGNDASEGQAEMAKNTTAESFVVINHAQAYGLRKQNRNHRPAAPVVIPAPAPVAVVDTHAKKGKK